MIDDERQRRVLLARALLSLVALAGLAVPLIAPPETHVSLLDPLRPGWAFVSAQVALQLFVGTCVELALPRETDAALVGLGAWVAGFVGAWFMTAQLVYAAAIVRGEAPGGALATAQEVLLSLLHLGPQSGVVVSMVAFQLFASFAGLLVYARYAMKSVEHQVAVCALGTTLEALAWLGIEGTSRPVMPFDEFPPTPRSFVNEIWDLAGEWRAAGWIFVIAAVAAPLIVKALDRVIERVVVREPAA